MTPAQKVLEVERQVRAMIAREQDMRFSCPFCGLESTPENEIFCCNEAAEVVNAVLNHIEHIERCDVVERAMDRLSQVNYSQVVLN